MGWIGDRERRYSERVQEQQASGCVDLRAVQVVGLAVVPDVLQMVVESQRTDAHWSAAQHGFERHAAIGNSRSGSDDPLSPRATSFDPQTPPPRSTLSKTRGTRPADHSPPRMIGQTYASAEGGR